MEHDWLVNKLNAEMHPPPAQHPLGSSIGYALILAYCVAVAMVVGFVGGLLTVWQG